MANWSRSRCPIRAIKPRFSGWMYGPIAQLRCVAIKVEPQLYVNQDWVVYPMEARVMEAQVPDIRPNRGNMPVRNRERQGDIARLRLRNALQDAALATLAPNEEAARLAAECSKSEKNPEAYLPIRDYLFRMR